MKKLFLKKNVGGKLGLELNRYLYTKEKDLTQRNSYHNQNWLDDYDASVDFKNNRISCKCIAEKCNCQIKDFTISKQFIYKQGNVYSF